MKFNPKVVSDFTLMKIPLMECRENLVNIRDYSPKIIIKLEKESKKAQNLKGNVCYVRESVAIILSQAQSLLPEGYNLKIIDGFRPMEAQKKIYKQVFSELKEKYSNYTDKQIELETDKIVANPKTMPPHCTGGAVDLTIVKNGVELNMGSKVNSLSSKAYTNFPNLKKEQQNNRKLLIKTMKKVGFTNYPLEWWHWSYGDRMWAFYKRKHFAIYGSSD